MFSLIKDTDVENFISSEGTNNLNHLSDVIVCDATQLIFLSEEVPRKIILLSIIMSCYYK